MIKYTKLFVTFLLAIIVFQARAQSTATTSSPYSQYGLGLVTPQVLPQSNGMGDISVATNNYSGYYNINPLNPATYGKIGLTVIDVGIDGSTTTLNQLGQPSQSNGNFRLSHVAFAFPISKHSAFSFGLLPYSELGYNYETTKKNFGTTSPADTNAVNYIYSGQGGLSKAYLGYGFGIGKHLLLGANVSYIFGNLQQFSSTEIPDLVGTLDSRVENSYSIGGVNYDYGAQYTVDFTATQHLIFGYSASAGTQLNSTYTNVVSQYDYDSSGNQNVPLDTLAYTKTPNQKIQLPRISHYGLTFMNDNKFLIGAEYSTTNWSALTIGGVNQELQNDKTYNLGGQFTPNLNALSNYWATIDYRLGFIYDQSYIDINDPANNTTTNIKSYALTFGLGLPLRPNVTSFYKINFSAEVGRRGTLDNGLVRENYVNLHLSFTLNDRWFIKYKLD